MWSTDSDNDDYTNLKEDSGHHEEIDTDPLNMSRKFDKNLGGPYEVQCSKPYKPVFVCFVDLYFALIFLFGTCVRQLLELPRGAYTSMTTYMPLTQVIYLVGFFLKFIFDLVVLHFLKKKGNV